MRIWWYTLGAIGHKWSLFTQRHRFTGFYGSVLSEETTSFISVEFKTRVYLGITKSGSKKVYIQPGQYQLKNWDNQYEAEDFGMIILSPEGKKYMVKNYVEVL